MEARLPLNKGKVKGLPEGLDALIACADLQGRESAQGAGEDPRLLGEILADELEFLSKSGNIPSLDRTGIILAGDFYSRLDRRGGYGDVRGVWRAFSRSARWVAGVAGNHDLFSAMPSLPEMQAFLETEPVHFLDGDLLELGGLRIGGISGIVGNPRKPFRRTEASYLEALDRLLRAGLDLLVLHDGPDVAGTGLRGWPSIREKLESCGPLLAIRGHAFWETPLALLGNGTQLLNVDSRVLLLEG